MRANRVFLLVAMSVAIVSATERYATAQPEETLQLRVYDVGDLVMVVRDYEYPGSEFGPKISQPTGGLGGGGGGFGGGGGTGQFQFGGGGGGRPTAPVANTTMGDLIDVIVKVVATDTWSENGGSDADIEQFGNSLVISQTPEVHAQIDELLNQLRAGSGERRSVTIDARWLPLNSEMLGHLVSKEGNGSAVNREALEEFSRQPGSIRMRTSCFSGQLVYVVSGTKRSVVSGYIPVVGSLDDGAEMKRLVSATRRGPFRLVANEGSSIYTSGSAVGYQALVEKLNIGTLLEIRPTLLRDTKTAIVDLKATVTGSEKSDGEALQPVSPGPPEVDRVAIQTEELATTLRVPLGEPVLVGGMTVAPAEPPGEGEQVQLYLVLEVR